MPKVQISNCDSKKKNRITDIWDLREIYRKKVCLLNKFDRITCEDIAQEMICLALERQRSRGVPAFNMTWKWLFADSVKKVFGNWKWIGFGYCEYEKSDFKIISEEDFEEWLSSNWLTFSNGNNGNGKPISRYKIEANGISLTFDAKELASLLREKGKIKDEQVVYNFMRRGRTMWLHEGKLFRTMSECKRELSLRYYEHCPGSPLVLKGYKIPVSPSATKAKELASNAL